MLGALIVKSCFDGQTFKVGSGFDDRISRILHRVAPEWIFW
jgi:hypothetical protein